jgi:hypothetical protein
VQNDTFFGLKALNVATPPYSATVILRTVAGSILSQQEILMHQIEN